LAGVMWVAPDFEHFVYRYWIENVTYHEVVNQRREWADLSPAVRGYLSHYRMPVPPPLEVWPSPFPTGAIRGRVEVPGQGRLW
jgi:hypothetical protein